MTKTTFIWLAAAFLLLTPASAVYTQNEQWLQYHSAREIKLNGLNPNPIILELSEQKPSDVNLPRFSGEKQLFAKWMTSLSDKGFLWIALDRSKKGGLYDIFYLDSNGNGRLDDEQPARQYRKAQTSSYFGPVKVTFKLPDGPVSYHLNFQYSVTNEIKILYVSSGGWYQGEITIDGQKNQCILFDNNVNGAFNDKSLNPENADRILIGKTADFQNARFAGDFIEIDDKLYKLEIARDGAYIKLAQARDVKFGTVCLPQNVAELIASGQNGQFDLNPKNGIALLPVGKYQVNNWIVTREDSKGSKWELVASQKQSAVTFDVREANETVLEIGEPIVSALTASYNRGNYSFNQFLKGKGGESVTLMRNGARPQAPQVNIKNADGTYDRTYTFSYG